MAVLVDSGGVCESIDCGWSGGCCSDGGGGNCDVLVMVVVMMVVMEVVVMVVVGVGWSGVVIVCLFD